jgi:DNA-binding transcriptional MerR regulator
MAEIVRPEDIPKRALFKPAEVCALVKVPLYVLRSWEAEFPDLGVARTDGGPRVYRRADVERVVRIKHLVHIEGLTLAGARRRLDDGAASPLDSTLGDLLTENARERIAVVKHGLQSILDLLARSEALEEFRLAPPVLPPRRPQRSSPARRPGRGRQPTVKVRRRAAPAARKRRPA